MKTEKKDRLKVSKITSILVAAMLVTIVFSIVLVPVICGDDNINPTASITLPVNGSYYKAGSTIDLNITGSAYDVQGVDLVNFTIYNVTDGNYWNGTAWQIPPVNLTANTTSEIPTANWYYDHSKSMPTWGTNKTYRINVSARDSAGNWNRSAATASFIYDTTAPTITDITVPINGSWYHALTNITGIAYDEMGLSLVNITIYNSTGHKYWNGTTWSAVVKNFTTNDTSIWYKNSGLPSIWANGSTYIINATAKDNAGNIGAKNSHTFYIDLTIPRSQVTAISNYAGPAKIDLGTAGNFVILSETAITNTGASFVGDVGISPGTSAVIVGFALSLDGSGEFATSPSVTGKVYASNYASPTPDMLATAIADKNAAYSDGMARTGANDTLTDINGLTLTPGLYKFNSGLTIATDVTLSGGPNDVWIFQVTGILSVNAGISVILSDGAQAENVFWLASVAVNLAAGATLRGIALCEASTSTNGILEGRILSGSAITTTGGTITAPSQAPAQGTIITQEPLIMRYTGNDSGSGLHYVRLFYRYGTDNSTWGSWVTSSNNTYNDTDPWITKQWSFNFTNANGSGYYQFYSRAADNASNLEAAPIAMDAYCLYDGDNPTVTITVPANVTTYKIMDSITGTCADVGSGIESVNLTIYNTTSHKYWNGVSCDWESGVQWVNSTITAGYIGWSYNSSLVTWQDHTTYWVNVTSKDNATRTSTPRWHIFTFDISSPNCTIAYNISRGYYQNADAVKIFVNFTTPFVMNESTIRINITYADVTSTNMSLVKVNNTRWYYNWNVPAGSEKNGIVTVNIFAHDNATNYLNPYPTTSNSKKIDNTAPTCTIAYNSSTTYLKGNTALKIYANFTEAVSGMHNDTVKINITTVGNGSLTNITMTKINNTRYFYNWIVPAYSSNDGTFTVNIYAKDNATNNLNPYPTTSNSKKIDNTVPVASMTALSSYNNEDFTVNWSAVEAGSGVASWTVESIEGDGVWTSWLTNVSYTITSANWEIANTTAGQTVSYRVLAVDNVSNCGDWSSTISTTKGTAPSSPPPSTTAPPSKAPTARHGGPYSGTLGKAIKFNGSTSTANSGRTIYKYSWNFGDGTTGSGATPTYTYTTAGTFTVTLKVTDNQGSCGEASTTATISALSTEPSETISNQTMNEINVDYGISLEIPFYANDTNGDGIIDSFTDPNNILTNVNYVNISGHASFLLSKNNDNIPEFFWNTTTNTITPVHYSTGDIAGIVDNTDLKTITATILIEKNNWTYVEITDLYPNNYDLIVKTKDGRTISSDMVWREGGKIFILDDPAAQYLLIYSYAQGTLSNVIVELTKDSFSADEGNTALITLINFEEPGTVIRVVNYTLLKGNQILWSTEETVSFLGQISFNKTIATKNLIPGTYTYTVAYSYGVNQTALSQKMFTVTYPVAEFPLIWIIVILLVIIIVSVIIFITWRKGYTHS